MAVWKVERPPPEDILDALDRAVTREDAVAALLNMGLTDAQADDALDIVGAAASRGVLLSTGMHPQQFHGDFEDDRLFLAALRRAGHTVDIRPTPAAAPAPRASTFVVLVVGLLAVVALVRLLRLWLGD
jgi:hypothetical protein